MIKVIPMASLFALSSCSDNVTISIAGYDSINVICPEVEAVEFIAGNTEFDVFKGWLDSNSGGWSSTPVSYSKGVVVNVSDRKINLLNDLVVFSFKNSQYVRPASTQDIVNLLCPIT